MESKSESIRRIVSWINNPDENGGLWLPNIQRSFVWNKEQIEKLFDSIMREYPISTLLIWKTRSPIKLRKFINDYKDSTNLLDFQINGSDKAKFIVLDGQQRLQSLLIALHGSYNSEELFFNVLSNQDPTSDIEDIKFEFRFLSDKKVDKKKGWIKVKDLIFSNKSYYEISEDIINIIGEEILSNKSKETIRKNMSIIIKEFKDRKNIVYQELDSIDDPNAYDLSDVVEIFIRANSGGTPLGKSELMFSLLTVNWEEMEGNLFDLLEDINKGGYKFTKDFILKTCLVLIGTGAGYDVAKFRKPENLQLIKSLWEKIKIAIKDIRDFIYNRTYLKCDKSLPSYLPLITLIFYRYAFEFSWKQADKKELKLWLLRVLLTKAFSGSSDTLLDAVIKDIKDKRAFDASSINSIILSRGRNITLTPNTLLSASYGEKQAYLIFNILYHNIDFDPAYEGNIPTLDHIFPQSKLKEIQIFDPKTNKKMPKYNKFAKDQISNIMLLSWDENIEEKKTALPEIWFQDKSSNYLELHAIPKNKELWKLENYEAFIEKRGELLIQKFNFLLESSEKLLGYQKEQIYSEISIQQDVSSLNNKHTRSNDKSRTKSKLLPANKGKERGEFLIKYIKEKLGIQLKYIEEKFYIKETNELVAISTATKQLNKDKWFVGVRKRDYSCVILLLEHIEKEEVFHFLFPKNFWHIYESKFSRTQDKAGIALKINVLYENKLFYFQIPKVGKININSFFMNFST